MAKPIEVICSELGWMDTGEPDAVFKLTGLVHDLAEKVLELEGRLTTNERAARAAANTSSCLANGIIPD